MSYLKATSSASSPSMLTGHLLQILGHLVTAHWSVFMSQIR